MRRLSLAAAGEGFPCGCLVANLPGSGRSTCRPIVRALFDVGVLWLEVTNTPDALDAPKTVR